MPVSSHSHFAAKRPLHFFRQKNAKTCIWCIRFEPKGGLTKNYRMCEFMNCKKFDNLFIRALTHKYFLLTTIRKLQLERIQTKIRKLPKRSPFYVAKKLLFLGSRSDVFPKAWLKIYKSFGPRSAKAWFFTVLVLMIIRKTIAVVFASSFGCARTCFWKCSDGAIVVG